MSNLVNILRNETQSLKNQYIMFTEEWSANEFERLVSFRNDYINDVRAERNTNAYFAEQKKYYSLPYEIVSNNFEAFKSKMVKNAEAHYEQSILKLAARIEKKGLNQDNLKVETAHVGVNIDTVLTDGVKTVRAFTIIAEGEIQRPHYRYLIK